jgi:tetratricopeptide (TPR) repeat protein
LRAVQSGSIAGREYAAAADSKVGSSSGGLNVGSEVYKQTPGFTPSSPAPASASSVIPRTDRGQLRDAAVIAAGFILLLVAGYGVVHFVRAKPAAAGPREPLLLADFANTTGESVFDGALRDALEIQLQQSPFLNVIPAARVRSTLQLMERSPLEALTPALANDVCQRMGVKAVLLGSIAPLGSSYVIALEARACRSGETIARQQTQAADKTEVLASVSGASAQIRERLGESLGSIQKFNVPAQDATTASLEALKAYSMGLETRAKSGDVQAIPLFEHALELDPKFALASARLAAIYSNLSDLSQARTYIRQAFTRADSLSAPERFFIKSLYHYIVTGKLDEVVATYRLWIDTYPMDWVPHNNLGAVYERTNQLENALSEVRVANQLEPNSVVPYQQMARVLLELDRFEEAKGIIRDAMAKGMDSSSLHARAFDLAFIEHDEAAMQDHLRAVSSRPDRYVVLTEAARAALASGERTHGRELYLQAASAARAAHVNEFAGSLYAELALADALLGNANDARSGLQQALATSSGEDTTWQSAMAAAFVGRTAQATQLAEQYTALAAPAPDITGAQLPILQSAIALAGNDAHRALTLLDGVAPYEGIVGPWVPYLRGLSQAAAKNPSVASTQFRLALSRRGVQPTSLLHSIAQLQLARALKAAGDMAGAKQAYADFRTAWKGADANQPLATAAREEGDDLLSVPPSFNPQQ